MEMPVNQFKRAIVAGQQQIGLWVSLANAYSAEVVAGSGFDWLLLDGEHSPNDPPSVLAQLQAVGTLPHVGDRASGMERQGADQALPRHRRAEPADSLRAERPRRPKRRWPPSVTRCAACAAWRASRVPRASAAWPTTPSAPTRSFACWCRSKRASAWTTSRRSRAPTESTACSSGPRILRRASGTWARSSTRRTSRRSTTRSSASARAASPPGILATDEATARKYIEWGTTFTAVGLDAMILARETEKLAAKFR